VPEITFSNEEFRLMTDHRFFDVKADIIAKINLLLAEIENEIKTTLKKTEFNFPERVLLESGKVSKGENYLNCPYLVLDFPRLFTKKDIFSYRTIFWWGHYIGNAFILGGISYDLYIRKFVDNIDLLKKKDWHLCIYNNPWKLENEDSNYLPLNQLSTDQIYKFLISRSFMKVARIYSHHQYDRWPRESATFLTDLLKIMGL